MIYVDTSVLVALHTNELLTPAVVRWYVGAIEGRIATSDWSVAEFASALVVKNRSGQIDARQKTAAWQNFEDQCAEELVLLQVDREAFHAAAATVRRPGGRLRAADALHLAVARLAAIEEVATLDQVMQREARALRLRVTAIV